jgi:hypothetical protein
MTDFLNSLKADLLDRRLLPMVAVVAVLLVAALVYAVAGGGSTAASPQPIASSVPPPSGGLAVTGATAEKAVAETTDGFKEQQRGSAHNPFAPLASAASTTGSSSSAASSTTTTTSSSSSTSSGSGSSTTPSTGSSETKSSEPSKTEPSTKPTKKAKTVYHVAVLFGLFPPGSTPETVQLTPYENLKLQTPLPSVKQPLVVFRGVTAGGKTATFTIVGETILHGQGTCLPSPSQCQALDLKPGQTEQLEYLPPSGETVVYELRVVSIAAAKAKASAKAARVWGASKAGAELLRHSGLFKLPFLHYSSQPGVLVFSAPRASSARAHAAVRFHLPHGW